MLSLAATTPARDANAIVSPAKLGCGAEAAA